ncbi:MAG: hypothetical protein ACI4OT_00920 [Bacilli bacterium]
MLRFHIKTEYDDTVIKELRSGYNNIDTDFNLYLEDGTLFKDASTFTKEYIKQKYFLENYEDIKLRVPKENYSTEEDKKRDYYEFIPKKDSKANKFLLIVDKDIEDYASITTQIEDVKLTMQMNNKYELMKHGVKNVAVFAGELAFIAAVTIGSTAAVFYASNGYSNANEVFIDVFNFYKDLGTLVKDNIKEIINTSNITDIVNNIKIK